MQTSLDADGVKKAEKAKLQKASETLRRTFKVSGKDLPEHVQVSMKEWEENYARNLRDLKRVKVCVCRSDCVYKELFAIQGGGQGGWELGPVGGWVGGRQKRVCDCGKRLEVPIT